MEQAYLSCAYWNLTASQEKEVQPDNLKGDGERLMQSGERPIDGMVKCNYDTASNTNDGCVLRDRLDWGSSLLGMA
ncbi:hypothetical protein F2Q69_00040956 [Brassica cretica]|uniref:Uncharacterized protein n=1 Tax=Brassica cretica TaxID=69181 RepID=A0A8S9ND51_BRACR|nr:hypothetical protein F2Q69_00040956 [Brassica cretica]